MNPHCVEFGCLEQVHCVYLINEDFVFHTLNSLQKQTAVSVLVTLINTGMCVVLFIFLTYSFFVLLLLHVNNEMNYSFNCEDTNTKVGWLIIEQSERLF